MRKDTERKAIAFIRSFASDCSICLRRFSSYCDGCPSRTANALMREITQEESPAQRIDYSYYTRTKHIVALIRKANRPLLAKEIKLTGLCSPALKGWTLQQMVKMGVLVREFSHISKSGDKSKPFYKYFLAPQQKENNNEDNNTGNGECEAHQGASPYADR